MSPTPLSCSAILFAQRVPFPPFFFPRSPQTIRSFLHSRDDPPSALGLQSSPSAFEPGPHFFSFISSGPTFACGPRRYGPPPLSVSASLDKRASRFFPPPFFQCPGPDSLRSRPADSPIEAPQTSGPFPAYFLELSGESQVIGAIVE